MIHFGVVKRSVVFIILGGLLLGLIGAGTYLFMSRNTSSGSPTADAIPTPTSMPTLVSWDDPAGFTMQYPEGVIVNKHDEDKVNYAHVELTSATHPGGLIIWVKDLPKGVTDTVTWGKRASTPSAAISFDTTLGGQPAQKILVSGQTKTVTTGVVFDGVVWYVEATLADEAYWQSVYDVVIQSFAFKPIAPQAAANSGGNAPSGDTTVDEEEVLE